jgi:thiol-disulfide isomerase/thioredoxin
MNGKDVNLASFRGQPIILNFWATWCGPCKAEIPALIELADRYKAQHLTVLGVSVDDSPEDLRQFAAEYKMNYPVLVGLGHDDFQAKYGAVLMVPVTWFIKPDGTVLKKHEGPASKDWFEAQVKAMIGVAGPAPEAN